MARTSIKSDICSRLKHQPKKPDRHPNTSLQLYRHACRRFEKPCLLDTTKDSFRTKNPIRVYPDDIHTLEEICFQGIHFSLWKRINMYRKTLVAGTVLALFAAVSLAQSFDVVVVGSGGAGLSWCSPPPSWPRRPARASSSALHRRQLQLRLGRHERSVHEAADRRRRHERQS